MSVWNRLGTLGKDAFGSFASPFRFAWDMATAPWNDDEHFNGFANTIKSAATNFAQTNVKTIADVAEVPGIKQAADWIGKTNEKYLYHPLTALALMDSDFKQTWQNPDGTERSVGQAWDAAWEEAKTASLGQAVYGGFATDFGDTTAKDKWANYDWTDKAALDRDFSHGTAKYFSGTVDLLKDFTLDVSLAGGKAIKVAKGASWASNSMESAARVKMAREGVIAAENGVEVNKFTDLLDRFVANDSTTISKMPEMKDAPNSLVWALGNTSDMIDDAGNAIVGSGRKQAGLIYRAGALGDQQAFEELRALRPDIANPMGREQGVLDAYQQWKLAGQTHTDGMLQMPWEHEGLMQQVDAEMKAAAANDKAFANFWELKDLADMGTASVKRSVGGSVQQQYDKFRTMERTWRYSDKPTSGLVKFYQATPFHTMYKIYDWATGERPAGLVNLNDVDSIHEITAVIDRNIRKNVITGQEASSLTDLYLGAATPEARAAAVTKIEHKIFSNIAVQNDAKALEIQRRLRAAESSGDDALIKSLQDEYKLAAADAVDRATKIYAQYRRGREGAMSSMKTNGFVIDEEGNVIRHKVFESQSANYLPMMDFDVARNLMKRDMLIKSKNPLLVAAGESRRAATNIIDVLDTGTQLFKVGALLRLGYPIRNGLEAQLRIASTLGALTSLQFAPGAMKNLVYNNAKTAARLVDRMKTAAGGMSYEDSLAELQKAGKGLADTRAKIAELGDWAQYLGKINTSALTPKQKDIYNRISVVSSKPISSISELSDANLADDFKRSAVSDLLNGKEVVYNYTLNNGETRKFTIVMYQEHDGKLLRWHGAVADSTRKNIEELPGRTISPNGMGIMQDFDYKVNDAGKVSPVVSNFAPVNMVSNETKGQGIATAMLMMLRENFPIPVSHSTSLTPSGKGFVEATKNIVPKYNDASSIFEKSSFIDDPAKLADLEALRNVEAEQQAFYDFHNDKISKREDVLFGQKKRMASGIYEINGLDGQTYCFDDAFAGPYGDIHWSNSSASESMMNIVDRQAGVLSRKLVRGGYGAIAPTDHNYYIEWARVLNYQFGNSVVVKKLAAGESVEDVARWMRNSFDGRNARDRLGLDAIDAEGYVQNAKSFLDNYLPDAELQNRLANMEEVTPEMLRAKFTDPAALPTIHGHVIEENLNLVGDKSAKKLIENAFRLIGTLPEDAWSRHPVYTELYRRSLEKRVADFEKLQGRAVDTTSDVARREGEHITTREQALLMRQAHVDALRQTKSLLFTIERRSNLAQAMRFVSPFFSAFENSAKTWAKIAVENPQTLNRANLAFTAPNRMGWAVDANGNQIPADKASFNDYIVVNVPSSLKRVPFVGAGLASLDKMGVQKRSLDVVFQGEGIQVPVGPYVAMPINQVAKDRPQIADAVKWALPFGVSKNSLEMMAPAWARRQLTKERGQDDVQYANTYALIWQTEMHKARDNGTIAPTAADVKKMTDAYWNMRTVANLVLPFAPTFNSPYKFYIDQYRQMREVDPQNAQTKFWQTYGDEFFDFTMSLSKNNTGSAATIADVENAKKYSSLVGELSGIDPKFIGVVTGAGRGGYDFSQAAYQWQQQHTIAPNSNVTFRGSNDPQIAIKQNQAELGWVKYRTVMQQIDAVMQQRGLTSLQTKAGADLAFLKKTLVEQLGKQNIEWYKDYKDTNGAKYIQAKQAFNAILSDKKFMADHGNDPTWKSVAMYLKVREAADGVLAARSKQKNGSASLTAKSNQDIHSLLESTANKLRLDDIGFGDIYDRYFAYDPGYDPVLTGIK